MTPTPRTPREPVLTATLLVPVVVWAAAYFGFDVDKILATQLAGGVLLVGSLVARQRVRPLSKPTPSAEALLARRVRESQRAKAPPFDTP